MRLTVLAFLLLAAASVASAATPPAPSQQVNVIWFDDSSCAAWTKSAGNKAIRAIYSAWIMGFVSGHNYATPARQIAVGSFPASDALYQYMDQYCLDNPNSSFIGGAITLVNELRATATAPKPAPAAKAPPKPAASSAK